MVKLQRYNTDSGPMLYNTPSWALDISSIVVWLLWIQLPLKEEVTTFILTHETDSESVWAHSRGVCRCAKSALTMRSCIFVCKALLDQISVTFWLIPVWLHSAVNLAVSQMSLRMKFMRTLTEADPCARTPELWQWSSCPFQYCEPSSPHPQFPIEKRA